MRTSIHCGFTVMGGSQVVQLRHGLSGHLKSSLLMRRSEVNGLMYCYRPHKLSSKVRSARSERGASVERTCSSSWNNGSSVVLSEQSHGLLLVHAGLGPRRQSGPRVGYCDSG